jgi:AcrR family transcriptional regulator
MVQRKKDDVRKAILDAAFRLFSTQGYSTTTIPQIAREAGMSTANVYVYFSSKLDMLFTIYGPWLQERLDKLERVLARIKDPRERLQRLLMTLWRELPRESNGFANNVMQAVSTSGADGDYSPQLREFFQARVAGWVRGCMAIDEREATRIASVLLMAFDGFAMNVRLVHGVACDAQMAELLSQLLMPPDVEAAPVVGPSDLTKLRGPSRVKRSASSR